MATPPARRRYNAALITAFTVLSLAAAWSMRISALLNNVPVGFDKLIETGALPNGTRFKKHYTGIKPLDEMLSFLVAAFLYGPTGWNEVFYWQQLHFLVQITAIVAIMNVEACRERNRGSWLKYTAIFAFAYQNVGGAVIIPIWWILLHRASAEKSYFSSGRIVPLPYASLILPATVAIYTIPSIAMYVPGIDLISLQNLLAFWQLTPLFANVPLWFASPFVSSAPAAASKTRNADLPHLKLLYIATFLISIGSHWFAIHGIITSTNPEVSLSAVFLPSTSKWKTTLDWGLVWIFQWDWLIIAIVHDLAAWIAVYDVQRLIHGAATSAQLLQGAGAIAALTLLGGPGAALAAVWGWREEKLAVIEKRLSSGKKGL
ncbi:uncharacterized protein K460DRAFT_302760 [Cucurbitaria berberidis CBS 394.84]|uniref:Uncharacterized protein n=1 Tax=Cucurbitaria berberidis CBS 394.84 TaxID=1168544 RepID=A0A9P4LEF4_9PLEO|nr:uncharacterized protein K460DRAFT_302760 [Cucurbitaria berberidis CBS 394.84]KAF1851044.1 hypothetical protein K460DRAFT_302760 [Cucurbitaria berberidis CBS 394.84]